MAEGFDHKARHMIDFVQVIALVHKAGSSRQIDHIDWLDYIDQNKVGDCHKTQIARGCLGICLDNKRQYRRVERRLLARSSVWPPRDYQRARYIPYYIQLEASQTGRNYNLPQRARLTGLAQLSVVARGVNFAGRQNNRRFG